MHECVLRREGIGEASLSPWNQFVYAQRIYMLQPLTSSYVLGWGPSLPDTCFRLHAVMLPFGRQGYRPTAVLGKV